MGVRDWAKTGGFRTETPYITLKKLQRQKEDSLLA